MTVNTPEKGIESKGVTSPFLSTNNPRIEPEKQITQEDTEHGQNSIIFTCLSNDWFFNIHFVSPLNMIKINGKSTVSFHRDIYEHTKYKWGVISYEFSASLDS